MNVDRDVVTALTGSPDVRGMVGDRVWRNIAARSDAMPFVILRRPDVTVFSDSLETFEERHTVQVDCVGATASDAKRLARAARSAMVAAGAEFTGRVDVWAQDYTGAEAGFEIVRLSFDWWGVETD